jgi:AcrR family transcriptional regulator
MQQVNEEIGRREAHKRATRAAIKEAAMRLVEAQGFEATTVREIADAADVTERTFYRYFDGKAGLIADEALIWLQRLHDAIRERPGEEPPLQAVARAMVALIAEIRQNPESAPLWMFADTPQQYEMLQRAGAAAAGPFRDVDHRRGSRPDRRLVAGAPRGGADRPSIGGGAAQRRHPAAAAAGRRPKAPARPRAARG